MIFHPSRPPQSSGSSVTLRLLENARYLLGIFCFFLLTTTLSGQVSSMFLRETRTTLNKERGFVTDGVILLEETAENIINAMTDVSIMQEWLLNGMGEDTARDNKLLVSLNSLESIDHKDDACLVLFSLIISKHWSLSDRKIHVGITHTPENTGWINHIQYIIPLGGIFIKGGAYDVYVIPMGKGTSLVLYNFNIHLAGVAEWLFNETRYKRNIEWYINKIIVNYIDYLN